MYEWFNKFDQGVHVQTIFKLKVFKPNIISKIVLDEVVPFHTFCNVSGICHSFVFKCFIIFENFPICWKRLRQYENLLLTMHIALSLLFFIISLESFAVLGLCWACILFSRPRRCLKLLISPILVSRLLLCLGHAAVSLNISLLLFWSSLVFCATSGGPRESWAPLFGRSWVSRYASIWSWKF